MKPWTKEEFDKFKYGVCNDKHFPECETCDRNNKAILNCFDDLTSDPYTLAGE